MLALPSDPKRAPRAVVKQPKAASWWSHKARVGVRQHENCGTARYKDTFPAQRQSGRITMALL